MDMLHESTDESDETLSLSDLQIYSDPSSSSNQQEEAEDYGKISFRFKIITNSSPPPQKILVFGNSISVPVQKDQLQYRNTVKSFPVTNLAPVVVIPRRRRWWLMFGLGRSPPRMELFDLRSRIARGTPRRITPVNGSGEEAAVARRKSGSWSSKLFGPCIPIV